MSRARKPAPAPPPSEGPQDEQEQPLPMIGLAIAQLTFQGDDPQAAAGHGHGKQQAVLSAVKTVERSGKPDPNLKWHIGGTLFVELISPAIATGVALNKVCEGALRAIFKRRLGFYPLRFLGYAGATFFAGSGLFLPEACTDVALRSLVSTDPVAARQAHSLLRRASPDVYAGLAHGAAEVRGWMMRPKPGELDWLRGKHYVKDQTFMEWNLVDGQLKHQEVTRPVPTFWGGVNFVWMLRRRLYEVNELRQQALQQEG